jgi:hypothetical protein
VLKIAKFYSKAALFQLVNCSQKVKRNYPLAKLPFKKIGYEMTNVVTCMGNVTML